MEVKEVIPMSRTEDNEVKIGNGKETRVITMRHPPRPGQYLLVEGECWEVLSVTYEIPYRIPVDTSVNFIIGEPKKAS